MGNVIVVVLVDEPEETMCTGVFNGFDTEDEAELWVRGILANQKTQKNVRWIITELTPKSLMDKEVHIKLYTHED